jgi:HSP20 family protein
MAPYEWTELVTLEDTMTGYFLTRPLHFYRTYGDEPVGFNGGRRMPVDISTDDEAYVIRAAVPGLKPDEVEIQIHDEVVLLRGASKAEETEGREYLMRELCPADFERRLRLPEPVNAAKAEATVENGLLTLRIPFADEAKPKTIKVRAG